STLSAASAAWARACRSRSHATGGASCGWRTRARRRISPRSTCRSRASPNWWCRPTCRKASCARTRSRPSATSWRSPTRLQNPGQKPACFELFDISTPEKPKSIAYVDASGPHSRGVHQLWFCDGEYVHLSAGAPDFKPRNQLDDQFYRSFDVRNPSKPVEVGRWWLPGTRDGDAEPPPVRGKPPHDKGFRAHNTNVYPQRPDRCYLGYIDGGMFILDIADKAHPKMISGWRNSPPYSGFC